MASLNARCIRGPVGFDLSSAARVTIKFEQLQILGVTLLFIKTQNPAAAATIRNDASKPCIKPAHLRVKQYSAFRAFRIDSRQFLPTLSRKNILEKLSYYKAGQK
jgi:hypothetical protein